MAKVIVRVRSGRYHWPLGCNLVAVGMQSAASFSLSYSACSQVSCAGPLPYLCARLLTHFSADLRRRLPMFFLSNTSPVCGKTKIRRPSPTSVATRLCRRSVCLLLGSTNNNANDNDNSTSTAAEHSLLLHLKGGPLLGAPLATEALVHL